MISKNLPEEPRIFTMAHELKHHLTDSDLGFSYCDQYAKKIEIGAEIFAAELIFPEQDFTAWMEDRGIRAKKCKSETIVHLKRDTKTTLSYSGLVKRAEFLGFIDPGAFARIKWKKLEEEIYGMPIYKKLRLRQKARA